MIQVVNYKEDLLQAGYENAFFSPLILGAHLVIYGKGDGYRFNSPAKSIDIVGHELAHYFLEYSHAGKLPYYEQPGAINEHVSDVIGMSIKAKKTESEGREPLDYSGDFWRLGADWLVQAHMSVRHMLKPGTAYNHSDYGKDTQPAHMKNFVVTPFDAGGVHSNSGILNRTFALFAESVETPLYDLPLKIWLQAIKNVKHEPSFRDLAVALVLTAKDFDGYKDSKGQSLEQKMKDACQKTGILDYVVNNSVVIKAPHAE